MRNVSQAGLCLLTLAAFAALPVQGSNAESNCESLDVPGEACDAAEPVLEALQRLAGGVSVADHEDDAEVFIEVANFYFSARVNVVTDGAKLVWKNENLAGMNRHSVISSDIGGSSPVLPIFVGDTGGGKAFKSGELQPADTFQITLNLATMNPDGYMPLPNGDFLIKYHCYIHGSSQMNGFLLVKPNV